MKNKFLIMLLGVVVLNGYADNYNNFNKPERLKNLTTLQYDVTQNATTEKPFNNEYWNNHQAGIYVDVVSGEPLFSSTDKYDSGSGWPAFTKPIDNNYTIYKTDKSFFTTRTEVMSKNGKSHLGHVFDDGPKPTGKRYCVDSAALRFIAVSDMQKNGYGRYLYLFKSTK